MVSLIWIVDVMQTRVHYILTILMGILLGGTMNAQHSDTFKQLQEISIEQVGQKKTKSKTPQQEDDLEVVVNDSIFKLFDVDIDVTLGDISFDTSWGDPIDRPKIRANKASNLFGPVRHNPDGSIRWHRGFDFYAPVGTIVKAVGNGVVSLIQTHPDYGKCVLLTHKRPKGTYYSFYAHLSSIAVQYGETVQKGSVIGKSGTTGNASNLSGDNEHLHFEYRTSPKHGDRKQENPNTILKTKFYSADPKNKWQANVGVVKKGSVNF